MISRKMCRYIDEWEKVTVEKESYISKNSIKKEITYEKIKYQKEIYRTRMK